jgi:DNA polymerase-3 subunit alpha
LPPEINESFSNFSVVPEKYKVRFGLSAIKNVGYNVVELIINERKDKGDFKSIQDFISRVDSKVLNKKSLESLTRAGVFDNLKERNQILFNLENLLEWSKSNQRIKDSGQIGLFGSSVDTEIKLNETEEMKDEDKLTWEKELLGLYISGHPLEKHRSFLENQAASIRKINVDLAFSGDFNRDPYEKYVCSGETITIGGIISNIKKILTRKGDPMMFIKLQDLTDTIEVVIFPSTLKKNTYALEENKIVSITGKTDVKDGSPKIIASSIQEILES